MRFWRLLPKKLAKVASATQGDSRKATGDGAQHREEKLALDLIFACTRTHEAAVTAISFSADGHQMFTGDARGSVIMWGKDRKSGACKENKTESRNADNWQMGLASLGKSEQAI